MCIAYGTILKFFFTGLDSLAHVCVKLVVTIGFYLQQVFGNPQSF